MGSPRRNPGSVRSTRRSGSVVPETGTSASPPVALTPRDGGRVHGRRATLTGVDAIEEAWARVDADWANAEAHQRFVGVCVALDRLPEAGRRYRQVRETDPARQQDAARHIDTLIGLATQQLQSSRVTPATTAHKRTLTWAAFLIMLALMGAGGWLLTGG